MWQVKQAALLAVLWWLVALLSRSMADAAAQTLPVWLASGVTLAALLVAPRWAWPALLAGAAVAAFGWGMVAHQLGVAGALLFAGVEVVSMALGAWVATAGRQDLDAPAGAGRLIAGALLAAVTGASLATLLWAWARPGADLAFEWRAWALSTAVGLLLVAPLVVAYRGFRVRRSGGLPMAPFLGGAAAFAAFLLAVLLVFSGQAAQHWGPLAATLAYVPMPFLLVASLLWGPRGGTVATLLGSLLIIALTARGGGPFAITETFAGEAVVEVQGFVLAWAVVQVLTQALAEGRRRALAGARDWQLRYERTLQAVGVASVEYDAASGRATWGAGAEQVLGALAGRAASHREWLDLVDAGERGMVQAGWQAVADGRIAGSEHRYGLRGPDGRMLHVHERLAAVTGGDGRVEQVVALLHVLPAEPRHG